MELMKAIQERRTVRSFHPDPITPALLNDILEAATWAPSHFNAQPWEFIQIGQESRQKLLAIFSEVMEAGPLKNPSLPDNRKEAIRSFANDFGGAPVLVAVTCPPATIPTDHIDYPLATAAAIQNLLLAAWEKRIGGVWLSLGQVPQAKKVLKVPSDYSVIGIIALGYFDAAPPALPRIPATEKLRQIP